MYTGQHLTEQVFAKLHVKQDMLTALAVTEHQNFL